MVPAQQSRPREEQSQQDDESARSREGRTPVERPHQCDHCPRAYARKDHLVRHLQSHTAQRPFLCSHCRKRFVRKDLLIRHQSIHTVTHQGPVSGSPTFSRRVNEACASCAAGKVKCDDKKPCRRCQKRGIICSPSLDAGPGTQSPFLPSHLYYASSDTLREGINTLGELEGTEDAFGFSTPSCFTIAERRSMMIGFQPSPDQGSGAMMGTPSGNGIAQSFTFQKSYNDWETLIAAGKIQQASQAFKELPWLQSPLTTELYARVDKFEGELPLDEDQYVPPLFDLQARETLLADLVTVAGQRGWLSLSQSLYDSFPSPSLLDVLVHRFFKQHNRKIDPWIHAPTFRPNLNNLELTATIVAVSAINTPAASLRHVASIMLKLLRLKISEKIEDQSHLELELQLAQSVLIQLETHLWHGAHLSSLRANTFAEMIRLCTHPGLHGRLPETFAESLVTTAEDELPRKWRLWVISESYNRLMTRFCIYDNQPSMTLGTRTSTIISEYHLPLPQPKVLWLAQSPREWRQIYLSSFSGRALQIKNTLPLLSLTLEPECFLDKDIALKLVFHIIGGLIIDNRESLVFLSARAHLVEGSNEPTSAHIRQSELKSAINNFNTVFTKRFCPSNIGSFVVSYLLMTLHASIKDIEILAGRNGEEESWQMYQAMKYWPETPPRFPKRS